MRYAPEPIQPPVPLPPRMGLAAQLMLLGLTAAATGLGIYQRDYVVSAVALVLAFAAFSGFRIGAIRMLTSLAAIAAAIVYAPALGVQYEVQFAQWFGTTGLTNRFLSIGIVGVLISLAVTIVAMLVVGRIVSKRPRLARLNSWTGLVFGVAQGVLAILMLLGGVLMIEPIEKQRASERGAADTRGRAISNTVVAVAEQTRESHLGPLVQQWNPFTRMPELNKVAEVRRSVEILNNPDEMAGLLNHPEINRLKQRPEVKNAVRQLLEDREIRDVLHSGRQIDRSAAMMLMSHPAVLHLVDQPGFVEAAGKVISSEPRGKQQRVGPVVSNPML